MNDPVRAAEVFLEAAELNRTDSLLTGSTLTFPNYGQVVMTGDMHGHRRNFERLQHFCSLKQAGARHVILHELIHEEVATLGGQDTSHELLLQAAEWKTQFPEQVHFLQSNHELAQVNHNEITKNGRVVTVTFEQSVMAAYDDAEGRVIEAICAFLRTLPLAGRTPNRVFMSHSIPSPHEVPAFDASVLERTPTDNDLSDVGPVHKLVWGRYHNEATLTALQSLLNADYFLCGHQPQETGYGIVHDRMVILASNHNHGVFLPFDLGKPASIESLERSIRPFAAIA